MPRRKPKTPEAYIPPPESASGRNRDWDRAHNFMVATYRGIPRELHRQVVEIAEKKGVPVGEVARRLLEHGLAAYLVGDLKLTPLPRSGKLTLFPEGEE